MTTDSERPPSPVENITPWRDDSLEAALVAFMRSNHHSRAFLDGLRNQLEIAALSVAGAAAEVADIEAEWSSTNRDWYHWGLREIRAERAAIVDFRTLIEKAGGRVSRQIRKLNRTEGEQIRLEAEERKAKKDAERVAARKAREAQSRAFTSNPRLKTTQSNVMHAAYRLGEAPAEEWGPDTPLGLQLRGALAAYSACKEQLRAEEPPMEEHT